MYFSIKNRDGSTFSTKGNSSSSSRSFSIPNSAFKKETLDEVNIREASVSEKSREEVIHHKIEHGGMNDDDIAFVVEHGDHKLKNELTRKAEKMHKEKEHIQRMYGNDFDWKDRDGNLVKGMEIDPKSFGF